MKKFIQAFRELRINNRNGISSTIIWNGKNYKVVKTEIVAILSTFGYFKN